MRRSHGRTPRPRKARTNILIDSVDSRSCWIAVDSLKVCHPRHCNFLALVVGGGTGCLYSAWFPDVAAFDTFNPFSRLRSLLVFTIKYLKNSKLVTPRITFLTLSEMIVKTDSENSDQQPLCEMAENTFNVVDVRIFELLIQFWNTRPFLAVAEICRSYFYLLRGRQ